MDSTDSNDRPILAAPAIRRVVRCPNCGGDSMYAASNPARPFCSERCKNTDFGAWASESFRVPTPLSQDELEMDGPELH